MIHPALASSVGKIRSTPLSWRGISARVMVVALLTLELSGCGSWWEQPGKPMSGSAGSARVVATPAVIAPNGVAPVAIAMTGPMPTPTEAAADFHKNIQPLLKEYCYDCHGDGENKGKVAFDQLGSDTAILANTQLWAAALKNVRAGLMPAAGPKPSPEEIGRLAVWIKRDVFHLDPANPDPGRVTMRRLNRAEYTNTIRDLMGIEFSAEAAFPPDDSGRGFDNNADVLSLSQLLLEKYLQAADTITRQAVPSVPTVIQTRTAAGADFHREDGPDAGKSLNSLNALTAETTAHTFAVTQPGDYRVAMDFQITGTFDFSPGHCELIGRVDGKEVFREEVVWHERQALHKEMVLPWSPGDHPVTFEVQPLALINDPAAAPADDPATVPAETKPRAGDAAVLAIANDPAPPVASRGAAAGARGAAAAGAAGARGARGAARPPAARTLAVRVDSVRVEGPIDQRFWVAPTNYTRFFTRAAAPTEPAARLAYAQEVLRAFATRAFRRPVDDAKVVQLAELARSSYEQPGTSFEQGIAHAMLAVLASPRFLFHMEDTESLKPGETYAEVDEYALASRLSYFLWSSMPDKQLFDLAAKHQLRAQLPAQVQRMILDPHAQGLVKNFTGQWLQARDVETVPINARVVLGDASGEVNVASPLDFNGPIRKAMHRETEMYFDHVMREDRSVLDFIESDYTYLNELLAKYYDIPEIKGDEIRLVQLAPDSPRGGLLTQGTILAVTSNPTRTSPVKRGLFILDNFLGSPPPPPPPNIPALEEAKKNDFGHDPTVREMMGVHRADPLCSSCHARMDPLGLALENFNAMGNWREKDSGQPIESAGELITGEKFKNIQELKHLLAHERQQDFYRCLTEKLLTYALGRGLENYDVETVDQIVAQLVRENGRFSVLLKGVINSAPFQKQRAEGDALAAGMKTAGQP